MCFANYLLLISCPTHANKKTNFRLSLVVDQKSNSFHALHVLELHEAGVMLNTVDSRLHCVERDFFGTFTFHTVYCKQVKLRNFRCLKQLLFALENGTQKNII